ncbi:MAG: PEP-CTERM sorting domain-containing protein [Coleofasciculus sp. C1-SOL-03]|uniref:PEP-CTERM sorting domain-containing protein n=1 Tax=Coleofasciculus sp. C1-SOL-03 TaxID=3069522 RepID=UPI0033006403
MLKSLSLVTVGATVMALGAITQAEAAQIIQPQSASTTLGEFGSFILDNAINQSGLSTTYTSGVTEFASYLSGNPTQSFSVSWIGSSSAPGSVTFDLGNVFDLDGMAMWGTAGVTSVKDFDLFASLTGVDGSFVSLGSFVQNFQAGADTAQVFNFNTTTAQFIRMDITDSYQASNSVGIGEVAFRTADVTPEPVPEPMTIFGAATALGFGALVNRKNAKKQKNKDNN